MENCNSKNIGKLYLVSVGIGDVDNMTLRAFKTIEKTDIVFAMKFVREQYAELLKDKKVYDSGHGLFLNIPKVTGNEDEVRRIIRTGINEGKTIAVLDFGDPVFYSPQSGYLEEFADLKPEIVPGISSFNAANATIGHEIATNSKRPVLISEALDNGLDEERFERFAKSGATLVFFTMLMNIDKLVTRLKKYLSGDTLAVVVVSAGFKDKQRVIKTTLNDLPQCLKEEKPTWDYLVYIGNFL